MPVVSQILAANTIIAGVLVVTLAVILARLAYPSERLRIAAATTAAIAVILLTLHDYYTTMLIADKIAHYTLLPLIQVTVYVNGAGYAALDYSQLLAAYLAIELALQARSKNTYNPTPLESPTTTRQEPQQHEGLPR